MILDTQTMKAKLQVGDTFFQDMIFATIVSDDPICLIEFDVTRLPNDLKLTADGYGVIGAYGNGALYIGLPKTLEAS